MNKEIRVKIHSLVDVITNSSTVIYVQSHNNTIKYAKDLINNLLKISGSDKTADDLFIFKLEVNREQELDKDLYDYLEDEYLDKFQKGLTVDNLRKMSDKEGAKILNQLLDSISEGKIEPYSGYGKNYNDYDTRELVIKAKNDDTLTINLTDKIKRIFDIDGRYDG